MRVFILLLVVFLAAAAVEGKKPKGKGKKPAKPEPTGTGSGEEEGSAEKPSGKPSKGKGKGKGKPTKPEKPEKPEGGSGEGSGEGSEQVPEPRPGLCVSPDEMAMICMAGSALGEKAYSAWETCSEQFGEGEMMGQPMNTRALDVLLRAKKPKGKGKGKGKGKPSKCPKIEKIMEKAAAEHAGEICMFTEMGWLDNNMVAVDDVILEDVMTLPIDLSEALTGDEFDQCVEKFEESAMGYGKCIKDYTEEEQAQLMAMMNGMAKEECFKFIFEDSCALYMSNTMAAMAGLGNTGSGSG